MHLLTHSSSSSGKYTFGNVALIWRLDPICTPVCAFDRYLPSNGYTFGIIGIISSVLADIWFRALVSHWQLVDNGGGCCSWTLVATQCNNSKARCHMSSTDGQTRVIRGSAEVTIRCSLMFVSLFDKYCHCQWPMTAIADLTHASTIWWAVNHVTWLTTTAYISVYIYIAAVNCVLSSWPPTRRKSDQVIVTPSLPSSIICFNSSEWQSATESSRHRVVPRRHHLFWSDVK